MVDFEEVMPDLLPFWEPVIGTRTFGKKYFGVVMGIMVAVIGLWTFTWDRGPSRPFTAQVMGDTPYCGNSIRETGEQCDSGLIDGLIPGCQPNQLCKDCQCIQKTIAGLLCPSPGVCSIGSQYCPAATPVCDVACNCSAIWWPHCGDGRCMSYEGQAGGRIVHPSATGPVAGRVQGFGADIAPMGDLDADGVPDLAVLANGNGTPATNGTIHIVYMNRGGTVKRMENVPYVPQRSGSDDENQGKPPLLLGSTMESIGDVDSNGVPDLAVSTSTGLYQEDQYSDDEEVHILKLQRGGEGISVLSDTGTGQPAGNPRLGFGGSLASLGNGKLAVSLGAEWLDGSTGQDSVGVYQVYPSGQMSLVGSIDDSLPGSLVPMGDLNGDGTSDLAMGAKLFFMAADGITVLSQQTLTIADPEFRALTPFFLGDVDGNGTPDLLASAWHQQGHHVNIGMVWKVFLERTGSNPPIRAASFQKIYSPEQPSHFGMGFGKAVANVGDIDGDGQPDIIVGAPETVFCEDGTQVQGCRGTNPGAVWLFLSGTGVPLCPADCGTQPVSSSTPVSSSRVNSSSSSSVVSQPSSSSLRSSSSSSSFSSAVPSSVASSVSPAASSAALAQCGNGMLQGVEQCEAGIPCATGFLCMECLCIPQTASSSFSIAQLPSSSSSQGGGGMCGNGVLDELEQCDRAADFCPEGFACDYDSCFCMPETMYPSTSSASSILVASGPLCGNGILEGPEQCDTGIPCSDNGFCTADCMCQLLEMPQPDEPAVPSRCGDGILGAGEQCDSGIPCPNQGFCTSSCRCQERSVMVPLCGNGVLNAREECDDGNAIDGDGCDAHCSREVMQPSIQCGDGRIEGDEQCERSIPCPGTHYLCRNCQCLAIAVPVCGNGTMESDEECETTVPCADPSFLCASCRCIPPVCGDGSKAPGEECDDGNTIDGDGCSAACTREIPTVVASEQLCGNGIVEQGEACDDGNRRDFDGCSAACTRETPTQESLNLSLITEEPPVTVTVTAPSTSVTGPTPKKAPSSALSVPTPPLRPVAASSAAPVPSFPVAAQATLQVAQYPAYWQPVPSLPYAPPSGPVGKTGPASLAIMVSGAAAGIAWMRRKRRE